MEKGQRKGFFNNPLFRTRVTSANVKPSEALLGYLVGPFLALISNAFFSSYLNRYYTDTLGISTQGWFLPMLFGISVIFVVAGNIVVGQLIERTRTSAGKARPYILLAVPLVPVAIALLFLIVPYENGALQMVLIALSYNLYYALAYPMFYASHSSMVGLSTRNSNHRGILSTFSNAAGVAAVGIGASIVIPFIFDGTFFGLLENSFLFPRINPADWENSAIDTLASYKNWKIFVIVLCALTFIGTLLEYFFTRERITEENIKLNIKEEKIPMLQQIKSVVNNKYWWLILGYFFLFQFGGLFKNSSMTYFANLNLSGNLSGGTAQGLLGMIGGIPTAVGMVIAWPIANKLTKQKSIYIGMFIAVLGGLLSFIGMKDGYCNFIFVVTGLVLKGIGSIPAMYVALALLSDVLDHLEAKNGFRSDGFTMAIYGAIMVGMQGLALAVMNGLFGAAGYTVNELVGYADPINDNARIVSMVCYLVIELVCYAVIAVLMMFLNVEKYVKKDQQTIIEHQKATVLAAGGEWIDPSERLKQEQEEADRRADEARKEELRQYCVKKGKDFETEEQKYQQKLLLKQEKRNKGKKE